MLNVTKLKRKPAATEMIAAKVTPDIKARLGQFCKSSGVTISAVIGELVEAMLAEEERKPQSIISSIGR